MPRPSNSEHPGMEFVNTTYKEVKESAKRRRDDIIRAARVEYDRTVQRAEVTLKLNRERIKELIKVQKAQAKRIRVEPSATTTTTTTVVGKRATADECAICLQRFRSQDRVPVLDCLHDFHEVCIRGYAVSCKQSRTTPKCPLCRTQLNNVS